MTKKSAPKRVAPDEVLFSKSNEKRSLVPIVALGASAGGMEMQNTDRRQAQDALAEARDQYAELYNFAPTGYLTLDEKGRIVQANLTLANMLGVSCDRLINQPLSAYIVAEDQDIYFLHKRELLEAKKSQVCELRLSTHNGETLWVGMDCLVDEDRGQIRATVSDISERKWAEEERERIARLPAENPNAVLRVSGEGILEYANEAAHNFISALGADVGGRVNPEWRARIDEAVAVTHPTDAQLTVGDRVFAVMLRPVMDQGYVNVYATDITNAIQLEEQLHQAQKMEAVGHLAGGVAHDFNNILQAISGFTELGLTVTDPQDAVHGHLTEIAVAVERAAGLVRQLLTFSRRQVFRPEDLDLNEVIANELKMLRRTLAANIECEFISAHELGNVHVDRGQIEQVLMNLCVNASDAMLTGGRLTIKTANVSFSAKDVPPHLSLLPGRYVLLSVTDTGFGMSQETKEHIFEPFFTTKEVGKGTGLGLASVFGILKQSGAYVDVQSEEGKGTAFNFYFPARDPVSKDPARRVESATTGGSETILIAEDDATLLMLAKNTLHAAGYTVLAAKDGKEALRLFEKHADEIDMAVFDVVMPHMGGIEALEAVLKRRPELPHLFVSGYAGSAVYARFTKEKHLPMLAKPYPAQELLRKIREALDKK